MGEKHFVALFFHSDTDGCISAANVLSGLGRARAAGARLFPVSEQKSLPSLLRGAAGRFSEIYVLDLGTADKRSALATGARVTIIDHHESRRITGKGILHINPVLGRHPTYPVSYMTYLLFGGRDWQAFVGVVADWCVALLPEFMDRIWKGWGWHGTQEDLYFSSDAGKIASAVDCGIAVLGKDRGCSLAVKALLACRTPQEFLDGRHGADRLLAARGRIEAEVGRVLSKAGVRERAGRLAILKFSSRMRVKSEVVQRFKLENPGGTVFVFQKAAGGWSFSARGPGGLPQLVRGYGGGHLQAVGGFVPERKLAPFIRKIKVKLSG